MRGVGPRSSAARSTLPSRVYTVEAAHTTEGKERLRAYYEALGRFADKFAHVEAAVARTLWYYAKTAPEIAKVAFSGVKVEVGMTYTKQIAAATKVSQSRRDDLTNVFQQLGIINGVRNDILHYGADSVAEGRGVVSDALKAKGEPYVFPISPTALNQMTADLDQIIAHMKVKHLGEALERTIPGDLLDAPWRYKHPVPPKGHSKRA